MCKHRQGRYLHVFAESKYGAASAYSDELCTFDFNRIVMINFILPNKSMPNYRKYTIYQSKHPNNYMPNNRKISLQITERNYF